MDDEDGDPGNMETWNVHNSATIDGISVKETLMRANGSQQHLDNIDDPKEKKDRLIVQQKSKAPNALPQIVSCMPYKGYKKRLLAQSQDNDKGDVRSKYTSKERRLDLPKRGNKIAEYAQYLGLQPSTNFLGRNGPRPNCALPMGPGPSSDCLPTPNFNRKVYLCSACNTYFENWHLFLHMRDVHERHICLFCLGLFDQVERLSHHLSKNHSIPESEYTSVEDFQRIFRGPCYLICCSCEKLFTESDNFYNHYCAGSKQSSKTASNICSVCKQVDSHLRTCSMAPDTEDELSPTTAREISRKMSRVNRVKQAKVRRSLGNFETNKPKPVTDKVESTDVNVPVGENERVASSTRDTVAETIMEVSRCMDGEEGFREEKNEPMQVDEGDKVEETEKGLEDKTSVEENKSEPVNSATVEEQPQTENSELTNHLDNAEPISTNGEIPIEKDRIEEAEKVIPPKNDDLPENVEQNPQPTEPEKVNGDCSFSSSRSSSPTNQDNSVFSPTVENNVEAESSKNTSEETIPEPESETKERVTVSINAVPSSDRSLVFKICTNKNTFSISKSTKSETPRESEENNNSQASTSETRWNHCFKDSEQDSGKGNVSDTDSDRLAVVDSNESEAENKAEEDDQEEEEEVGTAEKSNEPEKSAEETNEIEEQEKEVEEKVEGDGITLAGPEIPVIDVNVEGILETMEIEDLLKKCISAASSTCVFCNHARLVAVNGKQLGLHMLAEHRFQPQHPAIIIHLDQFVTKVKNCLTELETCFFNLDSYDSKKSGTFNVSETRVYECFHCRFSSAVHKELYLHNRKMHQKSIILCVMCKSTFHSYSELLCHLCPGIYAANRDIRYRCCLCPVSNLPSAFRLMVHLRKVHHACDVCLESTGNQQRLSNHVWKHKLNHLCYRCGISYRNKPDITKHLFWKHGTESVLCKKCLQKKWPHVYHFCVPPTAFTCEECNLTFGKAVALKVHKRLHTNELPYSCSECSDKFVSRKLLQKHEDAHRAPPPPVEVVATVAKSPQDTDVSVDSKTVKDETDGENANVAEEKKEKEIKEPIKKVDVLDLPPLNLSSESDSESDQETVEKKTENDQTNNEVPKVTTEPMEEEPSIRETDNLMDVETDEEEKKQEAQIMDGIWDNFKSYTASLKTDGQKVDADAEADFEFLKSVILAEHDYWIVYPEVTPEVNGEAVEKPELNNEVAQSPVQTKENSATETLESPKKKLKSPKKSKQQSGSSSSDSSSDDSSSCSCGTNCSCSSSSSNSSSSSSSSSDSDSSDTESSPKKASSRRDRKKDGSKKAANCSSESDPKNENGEVHESVVDIVQISPVKIVPRESDLETDETLTDEDFYDEHPQLLALKMLAEKRNQQLMMLASVAEDQPVSPAEPLNNGISESVNEVNNFNDKPASTKNRKKVKNKKRKKSYRQKMKNQAKPPVESIKLNIPKAYYHHHKTPASASQLMTPPTSAGFYATSTPKVQPMKLVNQNVALITPENENKRSSKRKRIPKRFYGDSSDEENDKQVPKWRKVEPSFVIRQPAPPMQQPMPSIIPTVAPPAPAPVTYYQPPATEVEASGSDSDEAADSSSDSDSEPEQPQIAAPPMRIHQPERANLYCFCQCPYDEVSEMIACDASDCRIEWFHFECVGIMIPPKGKWYCPDCSRRLGLPQTSEDHAN